MSSSHENRRITFTDDEIRDLVSYIPQDYSTVFRDDANVKHVNTVTYERLGIISEIFRYDFDLFEMERRYDEELPRDLVTKLVLRRIISHLLEVAKETVKLDTMLFRIFFDRFPTREFTTATVTKSDMTVDRMFEELNSHLQSNDSILLDGRWSGTMIVMRLVLDKRKKKRLTVRNDGLVLDRANNYELEGMGKNKFENFCENQGLMGLKFENHCLAHAILLGIAKIEKSELWKVFLANVDKYLKIVNKDRIHEIENVSFVRFNEITQQRVFDLDRLYLEYLKVENYHLSVFKKNSDKKCLPLLFYDSFTQLCIDENYEEMLKSDNEKKLFCIMIIIILIW